MILKSANNEIHPYVTKDGAIIRELMHPEVHGNFNQSLAEATIPPGTASALHRHNRSEEIYHFLAGKGEMTLGDKTFEVAMGDTVCIPPQASHRLHNAGEVPLKLFCWCTPPYSHDETDLV
jgi:mannose-6-phosphate isomerase-like protein (cupin superfamily)